MARAWSSLSLQGVEPGLEFVFSQLPNDLAFGDLLPLFHWKRLQQAGHLKGQLRSMGSLGLPGERTDMRLLAGGDDRGLYRPDDLGAGYIARRTARRQSDEVQRQERPQTKRAANAIEERHNMPDRI
jgi:hypothetical protein